MPDSAIFLCHSMAYVQRMGAKPAPGCQLERCDRCADDILLSPRALVEIYELLIQDVSPTLVCEGCATLEEERAANIELMAHGVRPMALLEPEVGL